MKKTFLFILLTGIIFIAFYFFMTYDRNYTWSKEFQQEVILATTKSNFKIQRMKQIEADNIKLPLEKSLKLKIQKKLNSIGLMNDGTEYGEIIYLVSENPQEILHFKNYCLGDHIIGLEVEYKNIPNDRLKIIQNETERQFGNYKIIWTKI